MIKTKGLTLFSHYFSHKISQIYSIWGQCWRTSSCCSPGREERQGDAARWVLHLQLLHPQAVTPSTGTSPAALSVRLNISSGTLGNQLQVPHPSAFKQKINFNSFKSSYQKRMTVQGGVLVPQVLKRLFTIQVLPNTVIKLRTLRKENLYKRGWN